MKKLRQKKGFTFVEILLVMTIILIAIGVIMAKGGGGEDVAKLVSTAQSLDNLVTGAACWKAKTGNADYTSVSITNMKTQGCISNTLSETTGNSYGGTLAVAVNSGDATLVDITLGSITTAALGTSLDNLVQGKANASSRDGVANTWTGTY